MFSCKTAGIRNLLTVCRDRDTSLRPKKGVCHVVGPGETSEWLSFQVDRFGFCLTFLKHLLAIQAVRKHLPSFQKYAYANELTLLYASQDWKAVEDALSQDKTTLLGYLQTWRLKLSNTTTVTAAFHLNNKEAKRELDVYKSGNLLPFCSVPTYLGVKLDRSRC